jgi:hypothetical protein
VTPSQSCPVCEYTPPWPSSCMSVGSPSLTMRLMRATTPDGSDSNHSLSSGYDKLSRPGVLRDPRKRLITLFIYLFESRDKTMASSRGDMYLKQRVQRRLVSTKVPPPSAGALCASHRGPENPLTQEERDKKKEKSTSKERLEQLAVTPGG